MRKVFSLGSVIVFLFLSMSSYGQYYFTNNVNFAPIPWNDNLSTPHYIVYTPNQPIPAIPFPCTFDINSNMGCGSFFSMGSAQSYLVAGGTTSSSIISYPLQSLPLFTNVTVNNTKPYFVIKSGMSGGCGYYPGYPDGAPVSNDKLFQIPIIPVDKIYPNIKINGAYLSTAIGSAISVTNSCISSLALPIDVITLNQFALNPYPNNFASWAASYLAPLVSCNPYSTTYNCSGYEYGATVNSSFVPHPSTYSINIRRVTSTGAIMTGTGSYNYTKNYPGPSAVGTYDVLSSPGMPAILSGSTAYYKITYTLKYYNGANTPAPAATLIRSGFIKVIGGAGGGGGGSRLSQNEETYENITNIEITPNPATTSLKISGLLGLGIISKIEIINTSGQAVQHHLIDAEKSELELNVAELPKGIYVLRVNAEGEQRTQKFIKE
ncbi:MAG: T9SS type A sorting domain-containing protein [Bacteroidia bacterium]